MLQLYYCQRRKQLFICFYSDSVLIMFELKGCISTCRITDVESGESGERHMIVFNSSCVSQLVIAFEINVFSSVISLAEATDKKEGENKH